MMGLAKVGYARHLKGNDDTCMHFPIPNFWVHGRPPLTPAAQRAFEYGSLEAWLRRQQWPEAY